MRIAFITQDFPPDTGGIQTYSYEIAKHLSSLCEKFIVIVPTKENHEPIDTKLPFEVIRIPASNTLLGLALVFRLKKIVQTHQIDQTFHAQWQTALAAIRLRRQGLLKKVSLAAHGRELLFNPFSNLPLIRQAYSKYQTTILRQADEIFPVSNFTANLIKQSNKTQVIHNGTNVQRFTPAIASDLKSKLGLEHKKILFTICRHVQRKGIQDVLTALPQVITQLPNLHYLIGGSGSFTTELKNQVKELNLENHVSFTGRIPDEQLNDYYNLCDVFIMTPRETFPDVEGFGIVYLEANACKKPVIGTISGGVTDAIRPQETGLLVAQESPAAIGDAIVSLMGDESYARQLGDRGRQWVEREMNWSMVSERLYWALSV